MAVAKSLAMNGSGKDQNLFNSSKDTKIQFPLADLPNELIDHVFSFLDSTAPSELNFNQQPNSDYTSALLTPLKDLSRVSQRLRHVVLPRLFANARLDPYRLTQFLSFIKHRKLSHQINTIVAQLQGPCNHIHPAWWARLLHEIPARTFTIICAPHVFAELVNTTIVDTDAWAFNMSHQILRLKQDSGTLEERVSLTNLPNLFSFREWTELALNEGSSLKAYTTYEYFLKRTPSLLGTLHATKSTIADTMFARLRTFTFSAIFPFGQYSIFLEACIPTSGGFRLGKWLRCHPGGGSRSTQHLGDTSALLPLRPALLLHINDTNIFLYNHIDEVLKSVRKMMRLQVLKIKICPEPGSTVLDDEIDAAGGHFDVNDPWTEIDTAYGLIAHAVQHLAKEGCLIELRIDDVKMSGIREDLENSITDKLQPSWIYHGDGMWGSAGTS